MYCCKHTCTIAAYNTSTWSLRTSRLIQNCCSMFHCGFARKKKKDAIFGNKSSTQSAIYHDIVQPAFIALEVYPVERSDFLSDSLSWSTFLSSSILLSKVPWNAVSLNVHFIMTSETSGNSLWRSRKIQVSSVTQLKNCIHSILVC